MFLAPQEAYFHHLTGDDVSVPPKYIWILESHKIDEIISYLSLVCIIIRKNKDAIVRLCEKGYLCFQYMIIQHILTGLQRK